MSQCSHTLLYVLVLIPMIAGCVVIPVTGKNEIGFISTEKQIEIGKANYAPAQ